MMRIFCLEISMLNWNLIFCVILCYFIAFFLEMKLVNFFNYSCRWGKSWWFVEIINRLFPIFLLFVVLILFFCTIKSLCGCCYMYIVFPILCVWIVDEGKMWFYSCDGPPSYLWSDQRLINGFLINCWYFFERKKVYLFI